jgi:hypothetical protein
MRKYEDALFELTKALELDPRHVNAQKYYSEIDAKIKEREMQRRTIQKGEYVLVHYLYVTHSPYTTNDQERRKSWSGKHRSPYRKLIRTVN